MQKIAIRQRHASLAAVLFAVLGVCSTGGEASGQSADPCREVNSNEVAQYLAQALPTYGGVDFEAPAVVEPTDPNAPYRLVARYSQNIIAGCSVLLRSFDGKLTGDTIRVRPGDTIYLEYVNDLPAGQIVKHPQEPLINHHGAPFSFDITNLHTHGLHVDPVGSPENPPVYASDNVLIEIAPGGSQLYRIKIPEDHPSGLYWYHPHLHGSTAIQVSSGMSGALLIEGGGKDNGELASVPAVAAARRDILVLQQIRFGGDGRLELLAKIETSRFRPTLVNGQFVPTIRLQPGEVRRFGFVHAGVKDNIQLAIDGAKLYEVAVDGISLGRAAVWPEAEAVVNDNGLILSPGQRSEVLFKAPELKPGETALTIYLWDTPLSVRNSISSLFEIQSRRLEGEAGTLQSLHDISGKPGQPLARIVVSGQALSMALPADAALASAVPASLPPPTASDLSGPIGQEVDFSFGYNRSCDATGYCDPAPSQPCVPGESGCYASLYLVNDRVFASANVRTLQLNTAERWRATGHDMPHPFHIHVNPFYMHRAEADQIGAAREQGLWRDTVLLPADGTPIDLFMKYTDFAGKFVMHCHILNHEDRGMMQLIEIR